MDREPTRLIGLINAALAVTVGLLTLLDVLSQEVGGAVTTVLAAWILVAHELLRAKVTPVENATLTASQAARVNIEP